MHARRFGLFRVRSPLLTESLLFSFPAGTEMVHFPALSSLAYVFSQGCPGIDRGGFPHSEISGSTPVCGSPKLIAACHVLHRLLAPRHPPYALSSLTFNPRNRCRRRLPTRAKPGTKKPPTPPEHLTHCVLCGRKNYRLQDIQLSKSRRRRRRSPLRGRGPARKPVENRPPDRAKPLRVSHPGPGPNDPGGEYRARTGDLLVANQALSQLS